MSASFMPSNPHPPNVRSPQVPTSADGEVLNRITDHLRQSSYPDVRCVSCELHNGVLRMRGNVTSWYLKQVALAMVRHSAGTEVAIDDQLSVHAPPSRS